MLLLPWMGRHVGGAGAAEPASTGGVAPDQEGGRQQRADAENQENHEFDMTRRLKHTIVANAV